MLQPGLIISEKYRLRSFIGRGAMASVWSAEHVTLGRDVAIKFIHDEEIRSDQQVQRFLREARNAAAVQHRYIIDIFDFGQTSIGEPYMVMELLKGESFATRLSREPPLAVQALLQIVDQSLSGLHAAHEMGIIHRDLKPPNIYLVRDGDGVYPKLLDFGISLLTGRRSDRDTAPRLTTDGTIIGTPYYMSPEQVRDVDDLDQRTDLYSMGVIVYEALTGDLPFTSEKVVDLIVKIATIEPPPLITTRPEIGQSLSDFVLRAISRERDERFVDALEMRRALQEVVLPETPLFTVVCDIENGVDADSDAATWCSDSGERTYLQGSPSLQDLLPAEVGAKSTLAQTAPFRSTKRWWIWAVVVVVVLGGLVGVAISMVSSFGVRSGDQRPTERSSTPSVGEGDAAPDAPLEVPAEVAPVTVDAAYEASIPTGNDGSADSDELEDAPASSLPRHKRFKRYRRQTSKRPEKAAPRAFRDPGF